MSTLRFCRRCNNVLYPTEDKENKVLLHACRYCNHEEIADNNVVYRNKIHHSVQRRTRELENVAADPTLPRTKSVRCSQCNHGEAVFFKDFHCAYFQRPLFILAVMSLPPWSCNFMGSSLGHPLFHLSVLRFLPRVAILCICLSSGRLSNFGNGQRGRRLGTQFCLLQPNLWQPLERLELFIFNIGEFSISNSSFLDR
ncbi:hypothetical protein ACSQ67_006264 [Phaseolus vulgaris]